jgi:transposase
MSQSSTRVIGIAVHNDSMAVAYVAQDHGAEVTYLGTIGTRQGAIDQLIRKRPSKATPLLFVDAAGPCGSWLYRDLTKKGDDCWVVAPSLIPKKPGDRINTDRRDAMPRARLARAGDLTAVEVPPVEDAAMRDLTRAREDPIRDLQAAKCRLKAFWLSHDSRSTGRATWGPAHLRWRSAVGCPTPTQPIVSHADVRAVYEPTDRLQRLEPALQDQGTAWRLHPVVDALQALRGVPGTVAVTMGADIGDLTRVDTPRELMKCVGLIPAAYSSGEPRRQGSLTNAGHAHARRALVEGAWTSRDPATVSRPLQLRRETQPKGIPDISWKAQVRRCQRSRRLVSRGNPPTVVTVALARELAGFMWAIAKQVPVTPINPDA